MNEDETPTNPVNVIETFDDVYNAMIEAMTLIMDTGDLRLKSKSKDEEYFKLRAMIEEVSREQKEIEKEIGEKTRQYAHLMNEVESARSRISNNRS